jgi:hypothetical protein
MDSVNLSLGQKIHIQENAWEGETVTIDITNTRADPVFYYEFLLARNIMDISRIWQDQKINKKNIKPFHNFLFGFFRAPAFNRNKISDENLKEIIASKIAYQTVFDNSFRNEMVPTSQMLSYLAEGEWKDKEFSGDDRIYLTRYETDNIPLIWIVTSVNAQRNVVRLHVWSKSLFAYFTHLLKVQDIRLFKNFGAFCLGHHLNLLGASITRLYYTPYSRNSISAQSTTNVLIKMVGREDAIQVAKNDSEEEVKTSLGEFLFIEIDENMRNVYKNIQVRSVRIETCIVCKIESGVYYTKEYGRHNSFCGKECFSAFFLNQKERE